MLILVYNLKTKYCLNCFIKEFYDVRQPINMKIKTFDDECMRDKYLIDALLPFRLEIKFPHSIHAGIKIIQILV